MNKPSKRILSILFLTIFIDMVGMGILIPVFPMLIVPHSAVNIIPEGWTAGQAFILGGWLLAAYPLMQFLFAPILGQLSDRHGRKRILALSILGTSLSYVLFGYAIITHNIPLMFISRMMDGATGGNISVAQAVIGDVTPGQDRAKYFGLVGVALGLGFVLGPFLGGVLSDPEIVSWFHVTTPFWFAAGLALLNALFLWIMLPETLAQRSTRAIHFARPIQNMVKGFSLPKVRAIIPPVFLFNMGFTFFTTFWGVVLAEDFGFGQGKIGNFFGYMGIMIILAQGGLVRRLSGMIAEEKVLRFSILGAGLCLAPFYLIPSNHPNYIYAVPPLLAGFVALTKAFSVSLLTRVSDPSMRGEVMGINSSANAMAQVIPGILAGYIAAQHARLPILVGSVTALIGGFLFRLLYKARTRSLDVK